MRFFSTPAEPVSRGFLSALLEAQGVQVVDGFTSDRYQLDAP